MTLVKSLRLLSSVLGVSAVCAVIGATVFGDVKSGSKPAPATPVAATPKFDANKVIDELAKTKFSDKPVLTYKNPAGETIFAWQVKPVLPAAAAQPKDILVLVDTSASQAGDPMKQAGLVIEALGKKLGADDRLDIWTLNINGVEHTRSLTAGFKVPTDKIINETVLRLGNTEYAAGAVDLKAGLEACLKSFEQKAGRQQIVLFLGDGESTAGTPITEKVRVDLGNKLVDKNTQFFAVPLGLTVSANNLHGLSMLTGGSVVRAKENLASNTGSGEFTKRLTAAFDAPVLKADKATFGIAGVELLPNRLPPLRADRSTLVIGKLAAPVATLTLKVDGTVTGKKVSVDLAERLPAASGDHFFLNAMLDQWMSAGTKDAPVILAADRALAMAGEQFRLFRDEFVELGMKAISVDRYDHAEKLFQAATKLDPQNAEAIAGTKVAMQLRTGAMTKQGYKDRLDKNQKAGRALIALQDPVPGGGTAPVAPPAGGGIERAKAARAAADQEARAIVEETLKQVRTLKSTDPDRALEDLKRQRETVLLNSDLSDDVRRRLTSDLEASMRDVQVQGAEIKRKLSAERDRISQARYKLNESDRILSQEEQTKARIDRFRDLMSQARFELAYQEAQVMAQERISRGQAIPPEVTATYRIGQSATNLREFTELKRIREDRYLMCMLQVEKSFIPYPDEPPVHFPPASVWRELTANRKENYTTYEVGGDPTARQRMKRVRSILEDQRVNFPNSLKDTPLRTLKEQLEKQFDIKIVVREDLFKLQGDADGEIMDRKFKLDSNLSGVTLGSFLDVALLDIKASYIVRPEYIEITTLEQRLEEKVTLAFAVADLVLAIPSSVNPQTLQQNSQFQASQLSIFGVGQAQQFGNAGFNGGNFGNNGGNFGNNGGNFGNNGGLGMLGMAGGGMLGAAGGQLGQNGGNNFGLGGGALGATGGQLGQFGNLGGQFGIQGNDQSRFLTALIQTVVARGEWDSVIPGVPPPAAAPGEEAAPVVPPAQLNSLGFYPPVRALVIRGSTRYHPTQSFKLKVPGAGGAVQAPPQGNPNAQVNNDGPKILNPNEDPRALVKEAKGNTGKIWDKTIGTYVDDPMLAVNAADILNEAKEYNQTADVLKATIRHGRANANWTHEALAIALHSSKASPAEIQRASLSGIDLDPTNAKEYIKAAKSESELNNNDSAIELCKRAAALEPNMPDAYANALVYVERSKDVSTDVVGWAATNLMKRDWTNDGVDYTKQTKTRVAKIAKKLTDAGRNADADTINKALAETKSRDLIVEVRWQGQADLDMSVAEPSGAIASSTMKRTSGGGVLKCDILEQGDDDRSEIYSAAEAFTGTYKVTVKTSLGRAVGNKALVKVTKFPGTPKESFEIFAIDMTNPKTVEFKLDGGSRKDLANVPTEDSEARMLTTAAPKSYVPAGVGGGTGLANPDLTVFTGGNAGANMPLVTPTVETKFDSISPVLPGVRVVGKVSSDRNTLEYTASTVFTGPAVDIPMPKVNLLPGSERNK